MIAFICHPYHRGGVTRWMVDMAIAYGRNGVKVSFITVDPKKAFISASGKETIISLLSGADGVEIISTKVGWEFELGTDTYRAGVYKKLLADNVKPGVSVILSNDPAAWKVSALLNGYNFIGVLHADESPYYQLARKYVSHINKWVCVSSRIKRKLLEFDSSFSKKEIFVIPCGIFLPEYKRNIQRDSTIQLVYVGRIDEYQKRVSDLVGISVVLKNHNIDFHLTIIGDGPEKQLLENKVHEFDLNGNVSFTGWLSKEEIIEKLFTTDFMLLTSNFEGMPVAMMEALSTGCGIVSTRVSGVEDIEKDILAAQCLWLYDIGDINTAVKNIIYAINNILPFSTTTSARQLAEKEFSMDMCIKRYQSLISCDQSINPPTVRGNMLISESYSYLLSCLRFAKLSILSGRRK